MSVDGACIDEDGCAEPDDDDVDFLGFFLLDVDEDVAVLVFFL